MSIIVVSPLLAVSGQGEKELFYGLLFLANFNKITSDEMIWLTHTWSLAAEMQFYVAIAFTVALLKKWSNLSIALLLFGVFAVATIIRYDLVASGEINAAYHGFLPHASGLFLGAAISLASIPSRWFSAVLSAAAIFALSALTYFGSFLTATGTSHFILGAELSAAALIVSVVSHKTTPIARMLAMKYLQKLGLWSYGIYLWHYPIARYLRDDWSPAATFAVTLIASVCLASLTYRLIENPFRKGLPSPFSRAVMTAVAGFGKK